jgi:hypothetical protein
MSRLARLAALAAAATLAAATLSPAVGSAAPEGDGLYRPIGRFEPVGAKVRISPDAYRAVRVDLAGVRRALSSAPRAGSGSGLVFRVPTPAGGTERFSVQRTQVMESELAARHPELATYSGRSLDHPTSTIALDITPMGMHAAVRGPLGQRAWYVDPAYDRRGTTEHLSYYGGAVPRAEDEFVEREAPELRTTVAQRADRAARTGGGGLVTRKIYRLALTSDPSYADYFGTANVLAEKVTLINRVNQIYNDDLGIEMRLVNATDDLNLDTTAEATGPDGPCGAHPCFDPADPNDPESFSQLDFCDVPTLGRNRVVLGQLVGAANYDVGHIALGVNGGGIAYLGVVGADYKGGGCTGLPEPKGDFFALDYVAHELGHQFSGDHTFNGVQYACSGGNRNGSTSVEPGSGSSVMAYAGICLQDDLQAHTDPYFAAATLDESRAYTDHPTLPVVEVQTVSLRGFDTAGETISISSGAGAPVSLELGSSYTAAGIESAIEGITGKDVTIAGWGYDPYGDDDYPAPLTAPDQTGFQVIFDATPAPDAPGPHADEPALSVTSSSPGVSGFVGETAKGGVADNGGSTTAATGNHAPRVNAPVTRTIPIRTPFRLTGTGRDADGDPLTYLWEQMDIGGQDTETVEGGTSLVDNTKIDGPLFRVFGQAAHVTDEGTLQTPSPGENLAGVSPTRVFPDLDQILSGNTNAKSGRCPKVAPLPDDLDLYEPVAAAVVECYSEFLPTKGYVGTAGSTRPAMHFRLTARDGYSTGGGVGYDEVTLRIDPKVGPFLVKSQAKKTRLEAGSMRRITWAVNGTDKLAAKVRILLSVDGGHTWRFTLAKATRNDGSAKVRIPRFTSKHARIMIAANDNYFFDLNDAELVIKK